MKPPGGTFPGAAAGKCLLALTRQPLRRPGQPKATVPDSCIRAASAPDERSCIHGKPMAETGQSYFRGIPRVTAWPWPQYGGQWLTGGLRRWHGAGWKRYGAGEGYGREFGINGESSGKDGVNTNGDHRWYSLSYVG